MGNAAETMLQADRSAERRERERRGQARRAPHRRLDPLFAATLVNQVEPDRQPNTNAYPQPRGPRAGIAFDVKA